MDDKGRIVRALDLQHSVYKPGGLLHRTGFLKEHHRSGGHSFWMKLDFELEH